MSTTPNEQLQLNHSGWLERRKDDLGPYRGHIISYARVYEQEIKVLRETLERLEKTHE